MKKLPLGLFVAYLLFISSKSVTSPITLEETVVLSLLGLLVVIPKVFTHFHRKDLRNYRLLDKELDLKQGPVEDAEITSLKKENELGKLKLQKFLTEQEYSKREITKAVESKGYRF